MDEEGYMDFIPYCISSGSKDIKDTHKTEKEKRIWDNAIRECIKATVLDAGGFPGPQVHDMYWLMHNDDWRWEKDEEFMSEVKRKVNGLYLLLV